MEHSDLTYSEIVYLFVEQFIPKANVFDYAEYISDNKVKQSELAKMLFLCALVYLMDKNLINLEIENRRYFWIFKDKAVVVKNTKEHDLNLYGIEKKVFKGAIERKSVSDIVESLIPYGKNNPWDPVISIVREDLIQKEYILKNKYCHLLFFARYHYIVNQEKKLDEMFRISQIKQSLSIFKSNKDLYKRICYEIEYGVRKAGPAEE